MKLSKRVISLIAVSALALAGCDSNTDQVSYNNPSDNGGGPSGSGTVLLREDNPPLGTDSVGLSFLNAQGNEIFYTKVAVNGSVIARSVSMQGAGDDVNVNVPNVPIQATAVRTDYLRNGGFSLGEETENIEWTGEQGVVDDKTDPQADDDNTSAWRATMDQSGRAHVTVAEQGRSAKEFLVKGVAYSPAPIGYNTRQSLDLGDFFWDSPAPQYFIDWDGIWKRDIETMRSMGFNTIRVYNMIPYHLRGIGPNDPPIAAIPDPDTIPNTTDYVFEHKKFLDACWNNGKDPIYVIVGISMPDEIWYKETYDLKGQDAFIAAVIKFWDKAFPKMVEQTAHHPAVLGYTLFNEKAFPQYYSDTGGATAQFWWDQVKKYSEMAKTLAPDKLIGWATNDDPQLPIKAKGFLASHGGSLDFFGVNGYQTTNWNSALDNFKRSQLGDLARPIILTEFGMPNTTRTDKTNFQPFLPPALLAVQDQIARLYGISPDAVTIPGGTDVNLTFPTAASANSIVNNDPTVLARSAEIVGSLTKKAFEHEICVGQTYFDWSDEWWKQEPYAAFQIPDKASADPGAKKYAFAVPLLPFVQEGGFPQGQFPGGYWDEEGFGLHSIALAPERKAAQVYADQPYKVGANTKPDLLTKRQSVLDALLGAYQQAQATRDAALGSGAK